MCNPISFMMDHKQNILDAYNLNSSPKSSWELLCSETPGFESEMAYNTFKQYFRAFVLIVKEYEERENHIDGWSISQGKDGYYRGTRRFSGKLKSVYLGKVYDRKVFKKKIEKKELALGV